MQQPSIGRIVHYQPEAGGDVLAAIVTRVEEGDLVALTAFPAQPDAPIVMGTSKPYAEEPTPGCWSWPPRV